MNEITKDKIADGVITSAGPTLPHESVAVPARSMKAARKARRKADREAGRSEPEGITRAASPAALATITDNQPVVLVPLMAEEVLPVTTRAYWADRINSRLATGVTWIVEAGKDLLEAKESLSHGQFEKMFNNAEVKIGIRTAQKLMRIAGNGVLSKATNCSFLPPTVAALYNLSAVKETKLQDAIDSGLISPSMKISDARALAPKSPGPKIAGNLAEPCVVTSICTHRDPEAAFERSARILDKELRDCPDDKSRLQLCQKLVSRLLVKMTSINNQKAADAHSSSAQSQQAINGTLPG